MTVAYIGTELRRHAPFTVAGTATGVVIMAGFMLAHVPQRISETLKLLPFPKSGDRLLDVGCGTGHWSLFCAEQGYEVLGLDIAPEMVRVARAKPARNCHFEVGNACRLPAGNRVYKVVAAVTTLEFVSDPAVAVAGMVGCAAPGGVVLVASLNRLASLNRDRVARREEPYASARLLSPSELRALLRPYGGVRMASARVRPDGQAEGWCGSFWERMLLLCGRSAAPFVVAAVRVTG